MITKPTEDVAELLYEVGWRPAGDAQWARLEAAILSGELLAALTAQQKKEDELMTTRDNGPTPKITTPGCASNAFVNLPYYIQGGKHSPLPWHLREYDRPEAKGSFGIFSAHTDDALPIVCEIWGHTLEQSDANAALIVEAVNSHARLLAERDELAKALKALVPLAERAQVPMYEMAQAVDTLDAARALLARNGY